MPSRRQVLSTTAGVLLTGGCLSDAGSNTRTARRTTEPATGSATDGSERESITDTRGPDESTGTGSDCQRGYDVWTDPFDPVEQLPVVLNDRERGVVADAVEDDGTTVETYSQASVRSGVFARHDGAYYLMDYTEVSTDEVPARKTSVSWEKGQTAPDSADVLQYGELPESDRRALELTVYGDGSEGEGEGDGHPSQGLEHRDYPAPYPDGTADSVLVDRDDAWVEWDGRIYEVRVGGETTITRHTYDYEATRVATAADGFDDYVEEEYLVVLDDLSSEAEAVVDGPFDDGYRECEPVSSGFEAFRDRLGEDAELPRPRTDDWYVEYDGTNYLLGVAEWVV